MPRETTELKFELLDAGDASTPEWAGTNWEKVDRYLSASRMTNRSGGARQAGDVVIVSTVGDNGFTVATTANSLLVIGVLQENVLIDADAVVKHFGRVDAVRVRTATAIGDWLYTSTVAGVADSRSGAVTQGAFAIALQASAGVGSVQALLVGVVLGSPTSVAPVVARSAWSALYNDAAGALADLGLGADDTVLTSTGADSAPEFKAVTHPAFPAVPTVASDAWASLYNNGSGEMKAASLGAAGTVLTSKGTGIAPGFSALPAIPTVARTAWSTLYNNGSGVMKAAALGADGTVLTSKGTGVAPEFSAAAVPTVGKFTRFTSSSTWTRSSGTKLLIVKCIGGGKGGGAGDGTSHSRKDGGRNGSSGRVSFRIIPATLLSSTEAVIVGAGGVGTTQTRGADRTATTAAGESSFGDILSSDVTIIPNRVYSPSTGFWPGEGGPGRSKGQDDDGAVGYVGRNASTGDGGGTAGAADGGNGGDGDDDALHFGGGGGGGGSSDSRTVQGGHGGAGGAPGGGGGGGGAGGTRSSGFGGNGGAGGRGEVQVWEL